MNKRQYGGYPQQMPGTMGGTLGMPGTTGVTPGMPGMAPGMTGTSQTGYPGTMYPQYPHSWQHHHHYHPYYHHHHEYYHHGYPGGHPGYYGQRSDKK